LLFPVFGFVADFVVLAARDVCDLVHGLGSSLPLSFPSLLAFLSLLPEIEKAPSAPHTGTLNGDIKGLRAWACRRPKAKRGVVDLVWLDYLRSRHLNKASTKCGHQPDPIGLEKDESIVTGQ